MTGDLDSDLGVDVLVIGGGLQGLYVANALHPRFSVCVLADPREPSETLDANGYFSAGYDGNDPNRVQPARRAAGFWRLWAENNDIAHDRCEVLAAVAPERAELTSRLWLDATLRVSDAELPSVFAGGALEGHRISRLDDDVIMNPSQVMGVYRRLLEGRIVWGEVVRFGLVGDSAIDFVQIQVGEQTLPVVPRFVVLAGNASNADLLSKLAARFNDHHRRVEAKELVKGCQAVRRALTVCLRGPDLPLVAGHFDELTVVAHRLEGSDDVVWLVNPPVDDSLTVLGFDDTRFDPVVDPSAVAATVRRLFALSPELERQSADLLFGAYVARRTEHPMMAVADTSTVAQPVPARLESLGLEGFLALWPSHLAYTMVLGDVVAERVTEALRGPVDFSDGIQPADLAEEPPWPERCRWERPGFAWQGWSSFASAYDLAR
ncbi:MAG: FAD-binding oxidoreductase [Acidimicrobiales bacterium]|jgi:hypothetical protein|nr:FAD-binding oxidoreductase [Acidimicrobiales bacterium]